MNLVFATNNKHKLSEVKDIVRTVSDQYTIVSLSDISCFDDIPETAQTLEGNALLKARYVKEHYGYDCFADDTGLEVEALDGRPGVYSARYAGEPSDAKSNMLKLLREMNGQANRKARFRTVITLILNNEEYLFEGIIDGQIAYEEKGSMGFGYDPIFIPEGYNLSFAELGEETKNKISHRALAVEKLKAFLKTI